MKAGFAADVCPNCALAETLYHRDDLFDRCRAGRTCLWHEAADRQLAAKAPVSELVKFTLPKGAVLRSIAAADEVGSVWLHLATADGQPMLLLVNAKGHLVRTLSLK